MSIRSYKWAFRPIISFIFATIYSNKILGTGVWYENALF